MTTNDKLCTGSNHISAFREKKVSNTEFCILCHVITYETIIVHEWPRDLITPEMMQVLRDENNDCNECKAHAGVHELFCSKREWESFETQQEYIERQEIKNDT